MINTVLGSISDTDINKVLCHEHICCYSEYLVKMAGMSYIDKELLEKEATAELKRLKTYYGLNLFVDCTPVNIGRDIDLMKAVSKKSGVHIVCSTGFYYTDEPVLYNTENLSEYIIRDAKTVNAGVLKAAVESEKLTSFNKKLLIEIASAQKRLGLPICLHTNANNKNGIKALEILLNEGVKPHCITVGHLSDTDDLEYIKSIASSGCYIGLDRIYKNANEEYINTKVNAVLQLFDAGYGDKILLSHDESFFNGFEASLEIKENPRFSYIFEYIVPRLGKELSDTILIKNPINMLKCEG